MRSLGRADWNECGEDAIVSDRQPWEKQPEETPKAYQAFCVYRDMGTGRTVDGAYQRRTMGAREAHQEKRADGTWKRWSSQHRWVERANAYDQYLDSERLKAIAVADSDQARQEYLQQLERFRSVHLRAGEGGMMSVLRLKQKLDAFLSSTDFQITSIDDAHKVAMTIKAIESGSGDMWAAALGVKSLISESGDRNGS